MWVRKFLLSLLLSREEHDTVSGALYMRQHGERERHDRNRKVGNLVLAWEDEARWKKTMRAYELFGGWL
jgi:hypothetical protein